MGINSPIPSNLGKECAKAAKILSSFIDPFNSKGPDKVVPRDILDRCKGIAVLTVIKGGFIWSGRAGSGLVIARLPDGSWSAPSAIGTAGVGVGGQIGAELTDFLMILNTSSAVKAFSHGGNLTLGANVAVSGAVRNLTPIFSYSKSKGLFAGVSLEGSVILERKDTNEKFYGRRISAKEILSGGVPQPPEASPLYRCIEIKSGSIYSGSGLSRAESFASTQQTYPNPERDPLRYSSPYTASTQPSQNYNSGGYDSTNNHLTTNTYPVEKQSSATSARSISRRVPPPPPPPPVSMPEVKRTALALFSFEGQAPGDLPFRKGDTITIIKSTTTQDDWWEARIGFTGQRIPHLFSQNYSCLSTPTSKQPLFLLAKNNKHSAFGSKTYREMSQTAKVRDQRYKQLTTEDVQKFGSILPKDRMLVSKELGGSCDEKDLEGFNIDWIGKYKGNSQVVLFPVSAQEVSEILKYCNDQSIAVVPQGGNTDLVGASVPVFDEVIISMQKMNKIRSLDQDSGALVCDSGCILESLDDYISGFGLTMPIDLGAKGSCHIGGNVSTNAGGIRYVKYGSLHGSVLGLEAVLPDGTIVNNLSTLRKDSTGYDIKQLFIGAEGTIGIVTGVSILTARKPSSVNATILGLNSYENVRSTFRKAKSQLSEILSAFEFWDTKCMEITSDHFKLAKPFESDYPFYALIETSGSNAEHDEEKLTAFLENLITDEIAQDGVVAQDTTQQKKMWTFREGIPESLGKLGAVYKYDISLPISRLYGIVPDMKQRLIDAGVYAEKDGNPVPGYPVKSVVAFGHIGDGNLHLNIIADKYDPKVSSLIEPYVYEWVNSVEGSISAEHGLGVMKANCLKYTKSPEMIESMKQIKQLFDPKAIMNPYKFLPNE
ncbi:hypothetical protein BB560_001464 [Smittium megazygosporum]|uniref:FAD-binding PCMH-type domain-containing protein n=1 Tax=Smittium megazygosporum TaxID=133381 RepID=A0A2T9ZHR0_9FUNG|nr:hypothetical protein BB560_001464 [Smittium megazygosporum]